MDGFLERPRQRKMDIKLEYGLLGNSTGQVH
jgi:hypothetical protein